MKALVEWVWVPFLLVLGTVGPGLATAPEAAADPVDNYTDQNFMVICETLAERPLLSTVDAVLAAVIADTGWDAYQAGMVVGQAVYEHCPWNSGPIDRYIEIYAPQANRSKGAAV